MREIILFLRYESVLLAHQTPSSARVAARTRVKYKVYRVALFARNAHTFPSKTFNK